MLRGTCTVFGDRVEGSTWLVEQQQANGGVWSDGVHQSARTTYRVVLITRGKADSTDLHGNSLLLSTAECSWRSRSRQFTKRAANFTVWIITLNTNNIMHRIRARQIGIPAFRQTFNHGVSTSEARRLLDKLKISGIFGITEGDVVLDLGGYLFRDIT
jgi:hypothetical protein